MYSITLINTSFFENWVIINCHNSFINRSENKGQSFNLELRKKKTAADSECDIRGFRCRFIFFFCSYSGHGDWVKFLESCCATSLVPLDPKEIHFLQAGIMQTLQEIVKIYDVTESFSKNFTAALPRAFSFCTFFRLPSVLSWQDWYFRKWRCKSLIWENQFLTLLSLSKNSKYCQNTLAQRCCLCCTRCSNWH